MVFFQMGRIMMKKVMHTKVIPMSLYHQKMLWTGHCTNLIHPYDEAWKLSLLCGFWGCPLLGHGLWHFFKIVPSYLFDSELIFR